MSRINITNLTFSYDGSYDNIFEDVSLQLDTDWKLGFVGRNGRGKTTLLNLLMGRYEYSGNISASVDFEYFPFAVTDDSLNSVDVLYGIGVSCQLWELERELSLLELSDDVLYRPFNSLSHGERTKALLAALFLKENAFLLIDEPTNHLDARARQVVAEYLKSKKGFILVSHDRSFLDSSVDHILSINKANIEVQKGNFSTWWENKRRQDEFELSENEKLRHDIKKLTAAARRTSDWSNRVEKTKFVHPPGAGVKPDKGAIGHKAAKMMKRSKSIESRKQNAVTEKSKLLKNIDEAEALRLTPLKYHSEQLVCFKDVSISYADNAPVCKHVDLTINRGDRIALNGINGSGKSSVIKLLLGEKIGHTGDIQVASNLKISYVSQDTSSLSGNLRDYCISHELDESLFKAILRKLDFSRVQFDKDMYDYSGGQKKKVLIAKSLCEKAHLYIWDEPLNFIDLISRTQIEELILSHNPTMLFVEHDSTFNKKIATDCVDMTEFRP